MVYLLGKYWHIWISTFRMSVASSLSFITGVPFAMRHHFSWGTCCNVRHPSIPWAQHFVLAVSTLDSQRVRIWQTVKHVLHLSIYISYINLNITVLKTVIYRLNLFGMITDMVWYEGHLESKERFAIWRYLLIIGKKKNMQVLWHTFTYFST